MPRDGSCQKPCHCTSALLFVHFVNHPAVCELLTPSMFYQRNWYTVGRTVELPLVPFISAQ
jgi:hypothetical protein